MANAVYTPMKTDILLGDIEFDTADIRAVLVNTTGGTTTYTFSASHQFLSSVASGSREGTPVALTTKTVTNGVFDADDVVFTGLTTTTAADAIVLFIHTGSDATAKLIAYLDTGVTGLPVSSSGGNVTITWNASGIISL